MAQMRFQEAIESYKRAFKEENPNILKGNYSLTPLL
jgi:hypothetical protein